MADVRKVLRFESMATLYIPDLANAR